MMIKKGKIDCDDEGFYHVEKIMYYYKKKYLIKWESLDIDYASWELESNLNCNRLLNEFKKLKYKITYKLKSRDKRNFNRGIAPYFEVNKIICQIKNVKNEIKFKVSWKKLPFETIESEEYLKRRFIYKLNEYYKLKKEYDTEVKIVVKPHIKRIKKRKRKGNTKNEKEEGEPQRKRRKINSKTQLNLCKDLNYNQLNILYLLKNV